jgi:hypothetical protein
VVRPMSAEVSLAELRALWGAGRAG